MPEAAPTFESRNDLVRYLADALLQHHEWIMERGGEQFIGSKVVASLADEEVSESPQGVAMARTNISAGDASHQIASVFADAVNHAREHIPEGETPSLRVADFSHTTLLNRTPADEDPINLSGWDFRQANLEDIWITNVDLPGADLRGASLKGAHAITLDLTEADLREANLTDFSASGITLSGTQLTEVILENTKLSKVNFNRDDLRNRRTDKFPVFEAVEGTPASQAVVNFAEKLDSKGVAQMNFFDLADYYLERETPQGQTQTAPIPGESIQPESPAAIGGDTSATATFFITMGEEETVSPPAVTWTDRTKPPTEPVELIIPRSNDEEIVELGREVAGDARLFKPGTTRSIDSRKVPGDTWKERMEGGGASEEHTQER